jgi:hypothetical protein
MEELEFLVIKVLKDFMLSKGLKNKIRRISKFFPVTPRTQSQTASLPTNRPS